MPRPDQCTTNTPTGHRPPSPNKCGYTEAAILALKAKDSSGNALRIHCPSDWHKHGDRNPSAIYWKDTGFFKCYACSLKGFADDRDRPDWKAGTVRHQYAKGQAVTRYHRKDGKKSFSQHISDAKKGEKWPIYGLNLLSKHTECVVIVEGEQCARAHDETPDAETPDTKQHVFLSSAGGSSGAHKTDWQPLIDHLAEHKDCALCYIPDIDSNRAGERYIAAVDALLQHPHRAQIIDLSQYADRDGFDICDFFATGRPWSDLRASTYERTESAPPPAAPEAGGEIDDAGNSAEDRVEDRERRHLRNQALAVLTPQAISDTYAQHMAEHRKYDVESGRWLWWDDEVKHWRWDTSNRVPRELHDTLLAVLEQVQDNLPAQDVRTAKQYRTVRDAEAFARINEHHVVNMSDHHMPAHLLQVPGAVIDLRTGESLPPDPKLMAMHCTAVAPVAPPDGMCETRFGQFIQEIFESDVELISHVHEWLGYCATGETATQKLAYWLGPKSANGKSQLTSVVSFALGSLGVCATGSNRVGSRSHPEQGCVPVLGDPEFIPGIFGSYHP